MWWKVFVLCPYIDSLFFCTKEIQFMVLLHLHRGAKWESVLANLHKEFQKLQSLNSLI